MTINFTKCLVNLKSQSSATPGGYNSYSLGFNTSSASGGQFNNYGSSTGTGFTAATSSSSSSTTSAYNSLSQQVWCVNLFT